MSDHATARQPEPAARPGRGWARLVRGMVASAVIGLPLLGMAALAAGWARSHRVQEAVWVCQAAPPPMPASAPGTATGLRWGFLAETEPGLLALGVHRATAREFPTFADIPIAEPDQWARVGDWIWARVDQGARTGEMSGETVGTLRRMPGPARPDESEGGWQAGPLGFVSSEQANGRSLCWSDVPARPFRRGGELPGGHQAAHWTYTRNYRGQQTPALDSDRLTVVAPFWAWMVPGLAPIVAWWWCPPGRIAPRMTLRRTLLATASLGLYLGLLLRVPDADRAALSLGRFDARWLVGPDPDGSGRTVIGALMMSNEGHLDTDLAPEALAAIRPALARLTDLRVLKLAEHRLDFVDLGDLLPDALPRLEILDLCGSAATDATLARVARYGSLRQLFLGTTEVTDAGLVNLRNLDRLEDLGLENLPLTDAGLAHLRDLPRLRRLSFRTIEDPSWLGTPRAPGRVPAFSPDALQRLADALPSLEELIRPDGTVLRPTHRGTEEDSRGERP